MVSKAECSSVIFFLICLLKIENIRAQCERPSVGENRQLTAASYKDSYPDGSTAEFECSTGYMADTPPASKTITCTGSTWTELKLQCKKKSCGPLPDIANGRYNYSPDGNEGILYGAIATPECDEGYVLTGNPRICTEKKTWSDRQAICEEVKCEPPPDPENGAPTEHLEDAYGYQRVITYACNKGYFPSGSLSISCLANGKFETPPKCLKLSCEELVIDPNAMRTGARAPYELGSFVTVQCKRGYDLVGARELKCEGSRWSSPPPQCVAHEAPTTRQPTPRTTRSTSKAHEATTTRQPTPRTTRPTSKERDILPTQPTPDPDQFHVLKIVLGIGIPVCLLGAAGLVYYLKKKSSTRAYSGNVAKNEDGEL